MSPLKILVVEDAADMRSFLADTLLRAEGYDTYTAADGLAGLEMALKVMPDVIVADIHMPRLSGLQMAQQLAQAGCLIPVILITVESTEALARQALQAGVAGYLLKPFEPQELLAAISRALARAQVEQEHARQRAELEAINTTLRQRIQELEMALSAEGRLALERQQILFLNSVTHDLRSPLTAILAYVDLLRRQGDLNAAQVDLTQRIEKGVQSIMQVITALLELAQIEAGIGMVAEQILLQPIARCALDEVRPQAAAHHLTLAEQLPEKALYVHGDAARLRQMLVLLLTNAIQYTPRGGFVRLTLSASQSEALCQISDSGWGIPPEEITYLGQRFYRASNVRHQCDGCGLGLAIVKAIVDKHHGHLQVESTLNAGTTVSVALPCQPR